ncbi:hypothetical protein ROZALSC1DRAFT_24295, partial [Rozella allomycis CSF55]
MFAFISKKITTGIESPLKAVSWCNKDGYLVVGGSSKSNNVKVYKLDEEVRSNDVSGKIKKLDQILEGHYGKDSEMMRERLLRMRFGIMSMRDLQLLMRLARDLKVAVIINTQLNNAIAHWSTKEDLLAVCGESEGNFYCCFYHKNGKVVRKLKLPGEPINFSWDYSSQNIVFAIESTIYFGRVITHNSVCYCDSNLIYTVPSKEGSDILFWNTKSNNVGIKMFGLVNSVGTILFTRDIPIRPRKYCMNSTHVFLVGRGYLFVVPIEQEGATRFKNRFRIKMIALECLFSENKVIPEFLENSENFKGLNDDIHVTAMCCSDEYLIVCEEKGSIVALQLPSLNNEVIRSGIHALSVCLNCVSNKFSMIDVDGKARLASIEGNRIVINETFERRDCWGIVWSDESENSFALAEKNKVYIFHDEQPEEPVEFQGNIVNFSDLYVTVIKIDLLLCDPFHPKENCLKIFESKPFRDLKNLEDCIKFIQSTPHKDLWVMIGMEAIKRNDFENALRVFVRAKDYYSVSFIKRIQSISVKICTPGVCLTPGKT